MQWGMRQSPADPRPCVSAAVMNGPPRVGGSVPSALLHRPGSLASRGPQSSDMTASFLWFSIGHTLLRLMPTTDLRRTEAGTEVGGVESPTR